MGSGIRLLFTENKAHIKKFCTFNAFLDELDPRSSWYYMYNRPVWWLINKNFHLSDIKLIGLDIHKLIIQVFFILSQSVKEEYERYASIYLSLVFFVQYGGFYKLFYF